MNTEPHGMEKESNAFTELIKEFDALNIGMMMNGGPSSNMAYLNALSHTNATLERKLIELRLVAPTNLNQQLFNELTMALDHSREAIVDAGEVCKEQVVLFTQTPKTMMSVPYEFEIASFAISSRLVMHRNKVYADLSVLEKMSA